MVACAEVGEPGKIVLLALNYEASGAYAGGAIVYPGANAGHKHAPGSADMALAVLTLTGDAKANTPLGRVLTGDLAKADTLELRFPTAAAAATAWAWATGQAANPAAPACAALSSTMARVGVVQDPPAHIAHECLAAFQAELPAEVSKLPGTFFRGKLPDQWLALQNAGDAAIVAAVEATLLHGPAVDALIAENREPQAATTGPAFIAGLGAVLDNLAATLARMPPELLWFNREIIAAICSRAGTAAWVCPRAPGDAPAPAVPALTTPQTGAWIMAANNLLLRTVIPKLGMSGKVRGKKLFTFISKALMNLANSGTIVPSAEKAGEASFIYITAAFGSTAAVQAYSQTAMAKLVAAINGAVAAAPPALPALPAPFCLYK